MGNPPPEDEKKTAFSPGKGFKPLFDATHPRKTFKFSPAASRAGLFRAQHFTPLPPPPHCPHVVQCNTTGVCVILGMPPLVPCDWYHYEKPRDVTEKDMKHI